MGTLVRVVALTPTSGFFLCLGMLTTSGCVGPLFRRSFTRPSDLTATWRGHTGSMIRLFVDQSLSHSCKQQTEIRTSEHVLDRLPGHVNSKELGAPPRQIVHGEGNRLHKADWSSRELGGLRGSVRSERDMQSTHTPAEQSFTDSFDDLSEKAKDMPLKLP